MLLKEKEKLEEIIDVLDGIIEKNDKKEFGSLNETAIPGLIKIECVKIFL